VKTKTKTNTNGASPHMSVRLRPEIHEQLRRLKDGTHVPIEHLVTRAMLEYFAKPQNRKVLRTTRA